MACCGPGRFEARGSFSQAETDALYQDVRAQVCASPSQPQVAERSVAEKSAAGIGLRVSVAQAGEVAGPARRALLRDLSDPDDPQRASDIAENIARNTKDCFEIGCFYVSDLNSPKSVEFWCGHSQITFYSSPRRAPQLTSTSCNRT